MKQLKFSLLTLLLLFIAASVFSNDDASLKKEFKKQIKKDFSISSDGTVSLTNKYGDIRINSTSGNSVSIEVEITVNASSQSKADKVFERISIDFSNGSDYVNAATDIASSKNWLGWNSNNGDYKIDYHVELPKSTKLNLSHKYGDIFCDDRGNDVDVKLKYGNVNMGIIEGQLNVDCGYGKANFVSSANIEANIDYSTLKINTTRNGNFVSKYSKIFVDEAQDLNIDSKYDNYTLGVIENLENVGKYDDIKIESIRSMDMNSRYTNLSTDNLLEEALLKFKYGSIKIYHVVPTFKLIDIESDYVGVKLGFDRNANFSFDIHSEYASVKIPEHFNLQKEIRHNNDFRAVGSTGSGTSGGKLIIDMDYGNLKISENKSE